MGEPRDVVIGGGVIGVCTAYYLAARGRPVTLIERDGIAGGCSAENAGLVVPGYCTPLPEPGALSLGLGWLLDSSGPFYIRPRLELSLLAWLVRFAAACREAPFRCSLRVLREMALASSALYDELSVAESPSCRVVRRGLLVAFRSARALDRAARQAECLAELGIPTELLNGAALCRREPAARSGLAGAVFYPEDGHLDPSSFVTALAGRLESHGAQVRTETRAGALEREGRRVTRVQTSRGSIEAANVVVAAGAWCDSIAAGLAPPSRLQPGKGYSVTLARPGAMPALPLILGEAHVAVTPLPPRLRLAGTLELSGLDLSIDAGRVAALLQAPRDYLEGIEAVGTPEVWRGLRPCTPDGLPLVGRVAGFDNVLLATGHAMLGITLGPITGMLVAQLVCGEAPVLDVRPLDPNRFGGVG